MTPDEKEDLMTLIEDLTDTDECWFDHHGGCQAHGYLFLHDGQICPHAEAKKRVAEYRAEHPREVIA